MLRVLGVVVTIGLVDALNHRVRGDRTHAGGGDTGRGPACGLARARRRRAGGAARLGDRRGPPAAGADRRRAREFVRFGVPSMTRLRAVVPGLALLAALSACPPVAAR